MDILAIIDKKRLKQQLSYEELDYADKNRVEL